MTISTSLPVQPQQSSSSLWDSIWAVVQSRGLQIGDQLPSIRELADRLDVKQTAVRDAFLKAESLSLIKILPRAGAFLTASISPVKSPAPADEMSLPEKNPPSFPRQEYNLFHLLDARRVIEIELVGRAAERRRLEDLLPIRQALEALLQSSTTETRSEYVDWDIRFHMEIARLAGNSMLQSMQDTLMEMLRPHLTEIPGDQKRREVADHSHVAIYEALVSGNAEKARNEMRDHLSLAYESLLRDVQAVPIIPPQAAT